MSNAKLNKVLNELNDTFVQMKSSDNFLKKLPQHSWGITAQLYNDKINIEIIRNDAAFIESNNSLAASEIYWYEKIIPMVAVVLFNNVSNLVDSDVVRFNFKNEEKDRVLSCGAHKLAAHVYAIRMGDFGTMMSLMESES